MRIASLVSVLVASCVIGTAVQCAEGPLIGQGDFEFYLDIASLPAPGGVTLELIQIAVPSREVEYRETKGVFLASVRVKIRIRDGEDIVHQKGYVMRDERNAPPVEDDLSGFFFLVDSCYVPPGEYRLDVEVEDDQRRKKTLFGLLGGGHVSSVLNDVYVNVQDFPGEAIAIGDPVLIWSLTSVEGGGVTFVPNPIQIYGLKNDTLSFFTSALVPEASGADSLDVVLSILDGAGEIVGESRFKTGVAGGRSTVVGVFDVNTYPSGTYRVVIEAFDDTGARASAGKDFSVAWELVSWRKSRRDNLIEARLILTNEEYEAFERMSIGDQESVLNDFWKRIDPTPQTAVNESYETFKERLRYADGQFGGALRGALTDRGQLYIRLGPPDDVVSQVVPKTREEMTEALQKLESEYKVVAFGSSRGPGSEEYPRVQSRTPYGTRMSGGRMFRGVGMDSGAFELWIYNLRGDPIFERDRVMTVQSGLRYLFVDKDGVGDFRLIGTSEEVPEGE